MMPHNSNLIVGTCQLQVGRIPVVRQHNRDNCTAECTLARTCSCSSNSFHTNPSTGLRLQVDSSCGDSGIGYDFAPTTLFSTAAGLDKMLRLAHRDAAAAKDDESVDVGDCPPSMNRFCYPRTRSGRLQLCSKPTPNARRVQYLRAIDVSFDEDCEPGERRTGTRLFMSSELVKNLAKIDGIVHIYDFDVESIAYVTLWITARYNKGSLVKPMESMEPTPYSDWDIATSTMLCNSRMRELFRPSFMATSHKQFKRVYTSFFRKVHDHVDAAAHAVEMAVEAMEMAANAADMVAEVAKMAANAEEAAALAADPPAVLLEKIKASMDEPLEDLRYLTVVKEAQAHIQVNSLVEPHKKLERWKLITQTKCSITT